MINVWIVAAVRWGDPTRTVPPVGRCACRMAGFPSLTRTCTHTNSKYMLLKGIFQPA